MFACTLPDYLPAKEKGKDTFFETARFIMTKAEIEIYKHLAGKEEREEFIEDFWKKRDPTPGTEENENREEYQKRIEFANRWFREGIKGRGWDSERGRLLLHLGFPTERRFGEYSDTDRYGRLRTTKRIPMEVWYYYEYRLRLVFADYTGLGKLTLTRIPSNLLYAMDAAKFSLNLKKRVDLESAFKFEAKFKANFFKIKIPTKNVSFEEKDEEMTAEFNITTYIYRNGKKIDEIKMKKNLKMNKNEILKLKHIQFDIPYEPGRKGKYLFEVIVQEIYSSSKYRNFCKYKHK